MEQIIRTVIALLIANVILNVFKKNKFGGFLKLFETPEAQNIIQSEEFAQLADTQEFDDFLNTLTDTEANNFLKQLRYG